jgi:nicotinate-nucleotide adenylyltransferase
MKTGLFGGTFDPVHVGHLDVVRAARQALGLDMVWLVPARLPPHRRPPHASASHRFAMAALATQGEPGVRLSDIEMEATGPSYTTATLDRIEGRGWNLSGFVFVIGADAFRDIEAWKDYPRVLDRCDFAVVSRPGTPASALREALPALAGRMRDVPADRQSDGPASHEATTSRPGILLVDALTAPVSSTDVRRAISRGASLDGLLPATVASYIARHGLYQDVREGHESGKEPHEDTATPAS